jgi:hypothetical protein
MSRRATLLLVTLVSALQLISAFMIGKLAALMQFEFALAAGLVLVGFLRARWLIVGLAVAVLTWPVLYTVRNETRQAAVGSDVRFADASSRLREDILMQRVATLGQFQIDEPGPLDIVRFGLVPRFLDSGRGNLSTPDTLSAALGESPYSADTFTILGTLWSLNGGYVAVVIYAGAIATVFALLYRRVTPMRMAFGMLVIANCLWIEATYPDNIAGLAQGCLSLLVAMGLAVLLGRRAPPDWLATSAEGSNRRLSSGSAR